MRLDHHAVDVKVLPLRISGSRSLKIKIRELNHVNRSAAMGIRTPVAGVKGPHDWPDYTIAARCST